MGGIELRPVESADLAGVNGLMREAGFKTRSEAGWSWLHGPGRPRGDTPAPAGWVLVDQGRLQGFLGNHALDYVHQGRELAAATCSACFVRPAARPASVKLFQAWFRQPGVGLFLSTTANHASQSVYEMFRAAPPADPCFADAYLWVGGERDLLRAALGRVGVPALVGPGSSVGAPLLQGARRVGRLTVPRRTRFRGEVLAVAPREVGVEFDRLGVALRATGTLQVRRDASTLRWYVSDPDAGDIPWIFGAFDTAGLAAYMVAGRHRAPSRQVTELRIVDLVFRPGCEAAVGPLLEQAILTAKRTGAGLVSCPPCGPQLAAVLRSHRPWVLHRGHTSHFLRATRPALSAELALPGAWAATGLDGDAPFCLEGRRP